MYYHSIFRAMLVASAMLAPVSYVSTPAFAQNDDVLGVSQGVIPKGVEELPGTSITYQDSRDFVTIGRPEDPSRMFLLYNVGTGKFLNVGEYWGTHAALSIVPRPFWFQHRNETRVQGVNSYMRYPENRDEHKGVFAYEFFSLSTMQVGNCEGGRRAHATYNYLRYVDVTTNEVHDILSAGTTCNGESFREEIKDFDFHKYRIEAQIDMSKCTATESGGGKMETLLSFGQDVSKWSRDDGIIDLHIYGFRDKQEGKSHVRVQPIDARYNDEKYKSGGNENPIEVGDDNLVTVVISMTSILVNGVDCMPRNTYADSKNHIPVVPYKAELAGQPVKFKTEADTLVLDANGKYIIDQNGGNSQAVRVDNSFLYSGDDLSDDEKSKAMPYFLTSNFSKNASASRNEGTWLLWSKYNVDSRRYGTVGVFGDRALPYTGYENVDEVLDNSRWFFEPVGDDGQNIYKMYLEADTLVTIDKPGGDCTKHEGRRKYYLQATDNYVYGNNYENYKDNPQIEDRTCAEALDALPTGDEEKFAYWKVISMADYYRLFENPSSEFTSMLDLSFLLSDPDFIPENGRLGDWKMEDGLAGKVRIGYDQYSKKATTDNDYTDDEGHRDIQENVTMVQEGNAQYQKIKGYKINHGRYMGVDVRGEASGKFYQDVTVKNAGWYTISCGGMSNAGATLFIQMLDKGGQPSAAVENPLHVLTADEKAWYDSPEDKGWPYDCVRTDDGNTYGMPMYNALVAINDDNAANGYDKMAGEKLVERYSTQTAFFVDPNVLSANGDTLVLRFGINVPSVSDQDADSRWTVFDNFHLSFGGYALEPNLILSEDSANLDYINEALHVFALRPMRLKRTFSKGNWNTLVLPVNLSQSDFHTLFGEKAQLAQLDHLTQSTVEFKSVVEDNGTYLKAFKPYIIKVQEGYEQGKVDTAYTARLARRSDGGKTLYKVNIPAKHYYLESATLQGYKTDASGQTYYDYGVSDYVCQDDVLARDESGACIPLRAYGTLCRTYEGNTILPDRPDLKGAYVMFGNNMQEIGNAYGTKGFRCWFVPEAASDETTDMNGVKVVVDGEDTGTGIGDLVDADGGVFVGQYAQGVYNLAGQKVRQGTSLENLPAGIYIVNGVKYAIK